MNKYVVSFISFFDNHLGQELIEASTAKEAVLLSSYNLGFCLENAKTFEEAQASAFDADCMFSVIKVS